MKRRTSIALIQLIEDHTTALLGLLHTVANLLMTLTYK